MLVADAVSQRPCRFRAAANDRSGPNLPGLFSQQPLETFGRGETVYRDGDPATHVFKIVAGIVRIARILSDGSRVITGFLYPGEIFGLSPDEHCLGDAEAVGSVKLRRLNRKRFQQAVDSSELLRPQFVDWLCREMAGAQARMVLLARRNAEERVCDLLLTLTRRAGDESGPATMIEIPMSRVDMADYLGLTIETVSRTMTSLINRGVIRSIARYRFDICKPALLRRLADRGDEDDDLNGIAHGRPAMRPH
ncbi:helix-turn-helix domain-containing protein [Bosea sp. (in: a-proteobacteria)]|uniref:helix-turn-helix domain-containing protein n=1 Tax=Bosea sp. (in: a-proteobacteria) TaxID=1871050 RepID=UPI0026307FA4|nr:helix-turn-helix domain-containing protein [Bosea sp. (in: a-proteobacteria)]MCO5090951.1 helix-turn-helix domain-containing protein [Bosea sp. (in: a-proteobacteria)]